jgi:hypothetical protein
LRFHDEGLRGEGLRGDMVGREELKEGLIWKLRNERVIGERNGASPQEITNRWTKCLNVRLELDCLLTNANKWGKKSLKKSLVLATWRKALQDEDRHPDDSNLNSYFSPRALG